MNEDAQFQHRLPDRVGHLAGEPELVVGWDRLIAGRRAEASVVGSMVAYQDRCEREALAAGLAFHERRACRDAALRDVALVMQLSERVASGILSAARFVRTQMPALWGGFIRGVIDTPRMRAVARTGFQVLDRDDLERLDGTAVEAAQRHPLGALQAWLRRFLARCTPEQYAQSCDQARADRWVRVHHDEDAMSFVEARIPTIAAAAIERRLSAVARGLDPPVPHLPDDTPTDTPTSADTDTDTGAGAGAGGVDLRTLPQRQADLFCAWLLDGRVAGAKVEAKIAVMIPAATLTGHSDAPGISADRGWAIPAADARHLAAQGRHEWFHAHYQPVATHPTDHDGHSDNLHHDPYGDGLGATGVEAEILSVVYTGRQAPPRLRDAITFRDGTCQAQGCTVPVERCDLDHQLPYPIGATTGTNLWALCRRHHRLKSHGHLTPPDERDPKFRDPTHQPRGQKPRGQKPRGQETRGRENRGQDPRSGRRADSVLPWAHRVFRDRSRQAHGRPPDTPPDPQPDPPPKPSLRPSGPVDLIYGVTCSIRR